MQSFGKQVAPRSLLSVRKLSSSHLQKNAGGAATPISLSDDTDVQNHDARELQSFHAAIRPTSTLSDLAVAREPSYTQSFEGAREDTSIGLLKTRSMNPLTLQEPLVFQKPQRLQVPRDGADISTRAFAASATPPPQDFDHTENCTPGVAQERRLAPAAVDTNHEEVSLPSPSLSPITAAAQMHRTLPASKLRQTEYFAEGAGFYRSEMDGTSQSALFDLPSQSGALDFQPPQVHGQQQKQQQQQQPQTPAASVADIGNMLDTFDSMPENLQTYVMYQLLRRCSRSTLIATSRTIQPALKVDFLKRLPAELRHLIVRQLDRQSLCSAARVSKTWRQAVDSDEKAWSDLITADGFKVPRHEVERAMQEGWGWQFPRDNTWVDMDLSPASLEHGVGDVMYKQHAKTETVIPATASEDVGRGARKRKRKESTKAAGAQEKKRRRTEREQTDVEWPIDWSKGFRPSTFSDTASFIVPSPGLGLQSLRGFHLFKSIYRHIFMLRRCWLDPRTKPKHIAFKAHEGHVVTCLQFDSEKILTGSDDAIIDIYDTTTGKRLNRLAGHEGGVWALEYQDNILVSGSTDRSVRIWDMDDGKCLHVFQGHTSTVRCLQIVQPVKTGTTLDGKDIMTPPHRLIITGSRDSSCRIWRLPTHGERGIFQASPSLTESDNPYFIKALLGHTHSVRAIAAHADTLVSGSYDGTVRVWKISSGETVHRLTGHSTKVYSVVLDHERQRCISGSMDTVVKVWSTETGECLFNLNGHQSLVGLLDLRDDILVSAAADFTLKVWDPETGKNHHTLRAHTGAITCFAHDGTKVISGSERTLKMWDIQTGEYVKDLLMDLRGVWQVRFDERRCIAAVHRNDFTYIEVC